MATASDYANMIWGALRLYQATNKPTYLDAAQRWCEVLDARYWLPDGGYAFTADDTPDVIVRMRGAHDDATPNANAVMLSNLMALFMITGNDAYRQRAEDARAAFAPDVAANPLGHSGLLANSLDVLAPQHLVIVAPEQPLAPSHLLAAAQQVSLPGAVQQWLPEDEMPIAGPLAGKSPHEGKATAYACLGPQCSLPVTGAETLKTLLKRQRVHNPTLSI